MWGAPAHRLFFENFISSIIILLLIYLINQSVSRKNHFQVVSFAAYILIIFIQYFLIFNTSSFIDTLFVEGFWNLLKRYLYTLNFLQ